MAMDRRTFLSAMGGGLAATTLGGLSFSFPGVGAAEHTQFKNWVWIGAEFSQSKDEWKRSLALMKAAGIQAILPELYNGRHAYFDSHRLPVKTDVLGTILPLARAEGLEVHGWTWCMPCMLDDMLKQHPDWYNVNAVGESAATKPAYVAHYKFLDPGRPEVREWVRANLAELAGIAELDGVHLDYIRHPDVILPRGLWSKYGLVQDKVYPQFDYGYTEYERQQFRKKFGADPLQILDPGLTKEWLQFRLDMVTALVNDYLVPAVHAKGKMISAAVFPGPALAREMVRQDWGRWNLDAFFPMLYNVFYEAGPEWIQQQTREGVSTVRQPIYSGLFVHQTTAPQFMEMIKAAKNGGASGVSLFSLAAMDDEKWKALRPSG